MDQIAVSPLRVPEPSRKITRCNVSDTTTLARHKPVMLIINDVINRVVKRFQASSQARKLLAFCVVFGVVRRTKIKNKPSYQRKLNIQTGYVL